MQELEALGTVPAKLLLFNDATHVVGQDYTPIHQGILVVTDAEGAQFTWGIANGLRGTVRACGGSYKKNVYISRGMRATPAYGAESGVLQREYAGPLEFYGRSASPHRNDARTRTKAAAVDTPQKAVRHHGKG